MAKLRCGICGRESLTLKELFAEYSEVFHSDLGLMEEFKAKLVVKPDAKPILSIHGRCLFHYESK